MRSARVVSSVTSRMLSGGAGGAPPKPAACRIEGTVNSTAAPATTIAAAAHRTGRRELIFLRPEGGKTTPVPFFRPPFGVIARGSGPRRRDRLRRAEAARGYQADRASP